MARNEEKSHSMLNRWTTYKRMLSGSIKPMGKRPALASDCDSLAECEKWRMQIIREIGKRVVEIQNESLGEQRIRDVNDEINKQFREKSHWERRIIELGGPNYRKFEKLADDDVVQTQDQVTGISDQKGSAYKYFGAARNLPGVKELFARKERDAKRQKRFDMRGINAAYYGYNDEDSLLEELEKESEKKALEAATKEWLNSHTETQEDTIAREYAAHEISFIASVNIPTREHIEQILLQKRKENVIKKYLMEDLSQQKLDTLGKRKTAET